MAQSMCRRESGVQSLQDCYIAKHSRDACDVLLNCYLGSGRPFRKFTVHAGRARNIWQWNSARRLKLLSLHSFATIHSTAPGHFFPHRLTHALAHTSSCARPNRRAVPGTFRAHPSGRLPLQSDSAQTLGKSDRSRARTPLNSSSGSHLSIGSLHRNVKVACLEDQTLGLLVQVSHPHVVAPRDMVDLRQRVLRRHNQGTTKKGTTGTTKEPSRNHQGTIQEQSKNNPRTIGQRIGHYPCLTRVDMHRGDTVLRKEPRRFRAARPLSSQTSDTSRHFQIPDARCETSVKVLP